jgi:signal transduction histidine kinase/ActR/RegA family two-component response regulator
MKRSRRANALPLALFALLATLTVVASSVLRGAVGDQERRLLHERAGEVGALLTSSLGGAASSLQIVGSIYQTTGSATDFEAGARPLAARGVSSIAVVQTEKRGFVVRAAVGKNLATNDVLVGERAALARRAKTAGGPVSTILVGSSAADRRLAFADALPNGIVVYDESLIGPARPIASTPDSPFNELQGIVYASPTADPAQILLTTTTHLPTGSSVDRRTITVGADKWLLVTASRRPLVGSVSRAVPWIVLILGLFASLIVAAVIALLLRRRAYALALVAERTADLQVTLGELDAARSAAETANHSKSEFLSRMSHELRTPLNAVLGFAQLLEIQDLESDQRDSVTQIVKGGRHLLELINEVLDIARIETGNLALSSEPVLPNDVVSDVIDLIRPLAIERTITITTNLRAAGNSYVHADRQRLRQVLLNLLSNAVKYNRIGGTIAVGCDQSDAEHLRITVTDTGPGIAPDLHAKLFQPFERLGAEQTNVEGTGVGLALSRRLADAMGGTLDFQSTVGQGSTFWIELPVVEGPMEQLTRRTRLTSETVVEQAPDHTVIYIEDNLANVKLVERLFAQRGDVNVVSAMQGRLGLDLARREPPALVLLDLHLPDIDGREVLQALRADPVTASLPIVVLSADATERQIDRLLADGANAYITKPIDVSDFLRTVDEYLPIRKPTTAPAVSS